MPAGTQPAVVVPMLASAARTTNGNSGNLKDTTGNLPQCEALSIYLDVTAITGGSSLIVGIDTSIDGGTTWYNAVSFGNIGASTGQRRLDWHMGTGWGEVGVEGSVTMSAAPKTNTPLTRDVRVNWALSGTSYTFAVYAICIPLGTRG